MPPSAGWRRRRCGNRSWPVLLALSLRFFAMAPAAADPTTSLVLRLAAPSAYALQTADRTVPWALLSRPEGFETDDFRISATNRNFVVASHAAALDLAVAMFPGFHWTVPPQSRIEFQLDPRRLIDFTNAAVSAGVIRLAANDGGKLRIGPGGAARLDLFTNASYYWVGVGQNEGDTADGAAFRLGAKNLPVSGGPLQTPSAGSPNQNFERLTPDTRIEIAGTVDGPVSIRVGSQIFQMPGGNQRLRVSLTNSGTRIDFRQDLNLAILRWDVLKGLAFVRVREIPGWEASARTDQSGQIQWDRQTHQIDFQNRSSDSVALVRLQNHCLARISPGATFHYGWINDYSFMATAVGGSVTLENLETGEETPLESGNFTFIAGQVERRPASSGSAETITLAWDKGAPLKLDSVLGNVELAPGESKVVDVGDNVKVAVHYDDKGRLQLTAVEGSFTIRFAAMGEIAVNLAEGNSASFMLDLKQGTFVVRTEPANTNPMTVNVASGAAATLGPDKYINFNLGQNGSITATSGGKLLLYEPAGSRPTSSPVTQPPVVIRQEDDISRFPQIPVSPAE